ncbi:MAG: glycosyltransferase family 2 protein [Candidatus Eisenbacteria bacterium]|nr:glycosyltransferase family 2 protein [Candidatus Eisenbacteria bacterium]
MKRLSVIVLNWNGLADTRALLDTLALSRAPAAWDVQILVVDNGSADGSAETLRAAYPQVEVLALPENLRFAGGNNAGLRRALDQGADAMLLLNNDTEADPGMIEHLVLALEQDPGAGAAAPLIYFAAPSSRIWYAGGRLWPALGHASHRGLRTRDRAQYRAVEATGYLTGCCLLAWREVWEKVGLLDERYFIYAEDADWCLRARAAGYRLLFVPTARLWHKVSASSGNSSRWKITQRLRANFTMFARHARGVARVTWLPAFLAQQMALAAWLALRGQSRAALAIPGALWDALRGRPAGEASL